MYYLKTLLILLIVLSGPKAEAQTLIDNDPDPVSLELDYTGDNLFNLGGGIRPGYVYLGMASLRVSLDAEKAGLWKGGFFHIHGASTHGATPSADLLGDMQIASNIEAGNHTYLQELWFRQRIGKVSLTIGLQDLNVEFAGSENGSLFLNSSFGIIPVISANFPASIFPLTTLGLMARWEVNSRTAWLNAVYDGSPTDFDFNPYNIKWKFASGDGLLAISELQHNVGSNKLPGTYKAGFYVHNHSIEKIFSYNFPDSLNHSILAAYVYADQKIWESEEKSLNLFLQTGYSPSKTCVNKYYWGFGINGYGFLSKHNNDAIGLAFAHAGFGSSYGSETTIEFSWQKPVGKHVFIQSDIQYIINPGGKWSNLNNCMAAILRFGISL